MYDTIHAIWLEPDRAIDNIAVQRLCLRVQKNEVNITTIKTRVWRQRAGKRANRINNAAMVGFGLELMKPDNNNDKHDNNEWFLYSDK